MPENSEGQQSQSAASDVQSEVESKLVLRVTVAAAEIESLLGSIRGAAIEVEQRRQSASAAATDTELMRTRAVEHSAATEAKLQTIADAAGQVANLAKEAEASAAQIATHSAHIEDAVRHAIGSRDRLEGVVGDVASHQEQVVLTANTIRSTKDEVDLLLSELSRQSLEVKPLEVEAATLASQLRECAEAAHLAKGQAESSAQESAKNSEYVSDGRQYIDAQRSDIERCASEAAQFLEVAKAELAALQTAKTEASSLKDDVADALSEATTAREELESLKAAASADQAATSSLAKVSSEVGQRVDGYEKQLLALKADFEKMRTRIEGLLPGATSAGLAAAFHEQRQVYRKPRLVWTAIFFVAIAGLVGIGITEVVHSWSQSSLDYGHMVRSLLSRLPIMGALIWLGLIAGAKVRVAEQAEEVYAHKEAISRSFEGYKKEFAALGEKVTPDSPVAKLCNRVMEVVATSPGHLRDGYMEDPTPASTAVDTVSPILEKATELVEAARKSR